MNLPEILTANRATLRRSSEFWDLFRDGVTISLIDCFLRCHEQFRLEYVEGWSSPADSIYLHYGNALHWFVARHKDRRVVRPDDLKMYDRTWRTENAGATPRELELHERTLAYSAAVWPGYVKQYGRRDIDWEIIEEPFHVEIQVATKHGIKCVPFRGVIDAAGTDRATGRKVLYEAKGKSRIDEDGIEQTLPLDFQTNAYCFAIHEKLGWVPEEIIYDVVRCPQHDLIKKDEGKMTNMVARIAAEVEEKPDHFFTQFRLKVPAGAVEAFVENQFQSAVQLIYDWVNGGPHVFNDKQLFMFGRRCTMYGPIVENDFTFCRRKPFSKRKER